MFGILIWVLGFQVNDGIFLGLGLISKWVLSFWVYQSDLVLPCVWTCC